MKKYLNLKTCLNRIYNNGVWGLGFGISEELKSELAGEGRMADGV